MAAIGIFGSCVTRDVWTFLDLRVDGMKFFARTSVPSMVSRPLGNIELGKQLGCLPKGGFDERCLRADIMKTAVREMEDARPAVLIFDFVDERFDLIEVSGSIFAAGIVFIQSALGDAPPFLGGRTIPRISDDALRLWLEGLDVLKRRIDAGPLAEAKLVLHRCFWAESYIKDGIISSHLDRVGLYKGKFASISEHNAMLAKYYAAFERAFPDATIIDLPEKLRLADASHRWGHAAFHFVPEYYQAFWDQIVQRGLMPTQHAML